jgi:hypothetical protein
MKYPPIIIVFVYPDVIADNPTKIEKYRSRKNPGLFDMAEEQISVRTAGINILQNFLSVMVIEVNRQSIIKITPAEIIPYP